MLGKKKHWTKSKRPDSKRYKADMAVHLDKKGLKCVTRKVNGIEEIIGKDGSIISKDGEILVYSSQNIVFRCDIEDMSAWELMSLEGVVITAPDKEHDMEERTIIAYYSYWRRMEN